MTKDYKKLYNEALERATKFNEKYGGGYAGYIFPELTESEDEKVRKALLGLTYLDGIEPILTKCSITRREIRDYLEKQKEQPMPDSSKLIEMWEKEEAMLKERDLRGDTWRIAQNAFMDGFAKGTCVKFEQKAQKPSKYLDKDKVYAIMNKLTNLSYSQLIPINSDEYKKLYEITSDVRDLLDYPIEQMPADKDAAEPTPKQDYSKLNGLERAIHRGFLCAGVENVPVGIIKETAQDCLAQIKPAEWSEEDEDKLEQCIRIVSGWEGDYDIVKSPYSNFLKSLRPQSSWKPSEEQMDALMLAIEGKCPPPTSYMSRRLEDLYEGLVNTYDIECKLR